MKWTISWIIVFFCTIVQAESTPMKNVGVFCSADDQISDAFKKKAFLLGKSLSKGNFGLITGGSKTGLMKEVIDGYVKQCQKHNVWGILPNALKPFNIQHSSIIKNNLVWTELIHDRLLEFHEKCDVVIILPGGFGTLHELMDFLVHQQFGLIEKRIILVNLENYWTSLLEQFKKMVQQNALKKKHLDQLSVVTSIEECLEIIVNPHDSKHPGLKNRYWEK
jgi:hypothetical protein